ncbi:MAG: 3-dehydroquinate dehydratase [Firmicutes bacterium]|nr:3-dehydroquinate dehydratase [Bacillota bacterium]
MNVLILHGPNLNMLEKRDPTYYGGLSQEDIFNHIVKTYQHIDFTFYQTNHEGEMIDVIQQTQNVDAIIVNLGAWTHYAYAIRDALELTNKIIIDVHLSDLTKREAFRQINILEGLTKKTFMGEKLLSYTKAIDYCQTLLD